MFLKWLNLIGIFIAVIVGIFAVAMWVVNDREKACAKRCIEKGYSTYDYKGLSGGSARGSINPDVCTCKNKDGSSEIFMGSSLWQ